MVLSEFNSHGRSVSRFVSGVLSGFGVQECFI